VALSPPIGTQGPSDASPLSWLSNDPNPVNKTRHLDPVGCGIKDLPSRPESPTLASIHILEGNGVLHYVVDVDVSLNDLEVMTGVNQVCVPWLDLLPVEPLLQSWPLLSVQISIVLVSTEFESERFKNETQVSRAGACCASLSRDSTNQPAGLIR